MSDVDDLFAPIILDQLARIAAALEGQNRAVWNLVRVGACGIVNAGDRHAVLMVANDAAYHANQALRDQDGDDEGDDDAIRGGRHG